MKEAPVLEQVQLANGTVLSFLKWGDGVTSSTRTLKFSANSTLAATYVLEAPTTTTTTSSSSTTTTLSTRSSSSTILSSSTETHSQAAMTLGIALVGGAAVVLGVLGAIFLRRRHS